MTIALDGTGTLVHNGRVVDAYPFTMGIMGARTNTSGSQVWLSTSQSDGDRGVRMWHGSSSANKNITTRSPLKNGSVTKSTSPDTSATVLKWMIGVFTSPTSLTIYFGDNTGVTGTTGNTDLDINLYNQTRIGSYQVNSLAATTFAIGLFAEAHWWNVDLTATDVGNLIAGTVDPEDITGWVDGLTMYQYEASGNYLSMTGTRTFVASGGVASNATTHPIAGRAVADTTAPILSSPVGASSGTTTATGSVTTDEAGTLYKLTSTNSTESSATIIASGATQTVTTPGVQNVTSSGLTASTTYYHHFVQRDAVPNTSNVVSSAAFTTSAAGDSTAPVLSSPTATATGPSTATGTVSTTNDANGSLYRYASTNATETASTIKAANLFQAVTATGVQNVTMTGLPPSTANLRIHYVHRDAAGNDSNVVSSAVFTTPAATGGSLTFTEQFGNSATGPHVSTTCTALVHSLTGALLVTRNALATDATGRLVSPVITDAALSAGTNYRTVFVFASGAEGMINRVAA